MSVLVALLVALTLVVSPTAQADPNQPGESPTISEIEPRDADFVDPPDDDPADWPEDEAVDDDDSEGVLEITSTGGVFEASASGHVNPPFDTDEINDGTYRSRLKRASDLPDDYIEPLLATGQARDQGAWGTCWAFAVSAAAESSLVRNGVLSGYEPAAERRLSPLHLVQSVYYTNTFAADLIDPLSSTGPYKNGGTFYWAAAAWSHWYGPEKEANYAYPSNQGTAPRVLNSAELKSSLYRMNGMYVLPTPRDSNGTYKRENVDTIKEAIYYYGAAYVSYSTSNFYSAQYWNDTEMSFYDDTYAYSYPHAVTIIGWDDKYSRSKFATTPPGDGAFRIMNSWGTGKEYKDYFWMSYYDTTITNAAVFNMGSAAQTPEHRSPFEWSGQYAHDELGIGNSLTYNTRSITYANRFTVKSNSTLRAVQLGTMQPDMSYKVQVYVGNMKATSPTAGGSAQALTASGAKSKSGGFMYAGYNTVPLDKPVLLKKGQVFSIVVTLTAPSGQVARATMEEIWNSFLRKDNLTLSAGQSFIKNGGKWYDLKTVYKTMKYGDTYGNFNIIGLTSATPKFMLIYMPNGGTVAESFKNVTYRGKVGALAKPTRAGYTFSGWYTKVSGGTKYTSTKVYTAADDVYVYAHWKAKKYTVKFNADGGSTPMRNNKVTKSKSVTFTKTYGPLPTTKRTGYTFGGWYPDRIGGVKVTSSSKVTTPATHTLYARWVPKTYTVKFDPKSGTADYASKVVTYNAKYGALPSASRAGYTFVGWFTKTTGGTKITDESIVKITGTQTLYARWVI